MSHFVKQALLNIARDTGVKAERPKSREGWVALMERLGVKVVHIAEKDTQASHVVKHAGEFVNTWSIEGYCEEGKQPAELGWGTHEKSFPADGRRHDAGCQAAIYLNQPGANVLMRTWTPKCGNFHGMLITHTEAVSIADYFTRKDAQGKVAFRPTVNFAYHPSSDAVMSMKEVRTSHTHSHARIHTGGGGARGREHRVGFCRGRVSRLLDQSSPARRASAQRRRATSCHPPSRLHVPESTVGDPPWTFLPPTRVTVANHPFPHPPPSFFPPFPLPSARSRTRSGSATPSSV